MTAALDARSLGPVPDEFDRWEVEQFVYREARHADESDYDAWEACGPMMHSIGSPREAPTSIQFVRCR